MKKLKGKKGIGRICYLHMEPNVDEYLFPVHKQLDHETDNLRVGDIGYQTLLLIDTPEKVYRVCKEWKIASQECDKEKKELYREVHLLLDCTLEIGLKI